MSVSVLGVGGVSSGPWRGLGEMSDGEFSRAVNQISGPRAHTVSDRKMATKGRPRVEHCFVCENIWNDMICTKNRFG